MGEPGRFQYNIIKPCALNIFIYVRIIPGNHRKMVSVFKLDGYSAENRTANGIYRQAWRYRIKSHGRKNNEGRHPTTIFITRDSENIILEPGGKQQTDLLLCFPGSSRETI